MTCGIVDQSSTGAVYHVKTTRHVHAYVKFIGLYGIRNNLLAYDKSLILIFKQEKKLFCLLIRIHCKVVTSNYRLLSIITRCAIKAPN